MESLRRVARLGLHGMLFLGMILLLQGLSYAEDSRHTIVEGDDSSDLSFEIGIGAWVSEGRTEWNHDASSVSTSLGNPSSDLTYKKLRSNVVELNGTLRARDSFFLRGNIGYGIIDDGTLIDDDFLSAAGAAANGTSVSGAHMFSRTESFVNDNYLWFVTLDAGIPLFSFFSDAVTLGVFGGYQHWQERVSAQGVNQLTCTSVGNLCSASGNQSFSGQDAITNTVQWDSFRIGIDSAWHLFQRLDVTTRLAFVPYTIMENQDTHHLRTDLRRDPSFTMTGTGHGYQADVGIQFLLVSNVYLHAGIRYWRLEVTNGSWRNHPNGTTATTANLNELSSQRYGGTFGLRYRF